MDAHEPPAIELVAADTPCIRCGYSLRGLPINSACPECATPVERSLRGDLLVYSDPRYVRKLRSGATMVMTSILLMVGMFVAAMVVGIGGAVAGAPSAMFLLLLGALGLVMFGAAILYLIGWWTLATPDRDQLTDNIGERPRTYVRYAVVGTVLMKVLSISLDFARAVPTELRVLVTLVDNIVMMVGLIAGLVYVRWLAERLPNMKIHKRALTLTYVIGTFLGLGILFAVGSLLGVPRTLGPAFAMFTAIGMIVLFVAGLVTIVMYYNLFSWLRTNLGEISKAQQVPRA